VNSERFRALVVEESAEGGFLRRIWERSVADLPAGEVLIRVAYSSLNYKDALSATGNKGVTRHYPHTPGIDAAGEVAACTTDAFAPGDQVLVTGWDLGMETDGGFGQYVRVPADWVLPLPAGMSLRESMILGTAGLTAAMATHRIAAEVSPGLGEVLVTGASGGVGSLAVALLAKLGFAVVAVSGKPDAADHLRELGAGEVITREAASEGHDRPLLKARWGGVVDTVGGEILAAAIKATRPYGVVTACGLVASPELRVNVFPFILRGVTLAGIDSQTCPRVMRQGLWSRLAGDWKLEGLDRLAREVRLEDLEEAIMDILAGKLRGRTLVDLR
jgi:putative YhdH/YhfP family quinone oxidoreductase